MSIQDDKNDYLWVGDDFPPIYSDFDDYQKINRIVFKIKSELSDYFILAFNHPMIKKNISNSDVKYILNNLVTLDAALKLHRYGVIYFINRKEAKKIVKYIDKNKLNKLSELLVKTNIANKVINYSVFKFANNPSRKIYYESEFIPKNAISAIGENEIYVRKKDFLLDEKEILQFNNSLYDLHDFSHLASSALNKELYGCKYFHSLVYLDDNLKDLIKSPYMYTGKAISHSDGLVFSVFLTHLFNNTYHSFSNTRCVDFMSNELVNYFLNLAPCYHHKINQFIFPDAKINIIQLLTLLQNKYYELIGSEIERAMFVRGGKDVNDYLYDLSPYERLVNIATEDKWHYFERRNTLKHRSQFIAYKKLILYFKKNLTSKIDKRFLDSAMDSITFKDYRKGNRIDLWKLILCENNISENRRLSLC